MVSQPIRRQVTDYARFTGRTAAVESVELRARVSGYLAEINYQPGDEVKAGKVLFRIDPPIYKAALEKAESDVKQFEAQLTELTEEYNRNRRLVTDQRHHPRGVSEEHRGRRTSRGPTSTAPRRPSGPPSRT